MTTEEYHKQLLGGAVVEERSPAMSTIDYNNSLMGVSNDPNKEPEQLLDKEIKSGLGYEILNGIMAVGSGLQGADYMNLPRIARSKLDAGTLNKFNWFFGQPVYGDSLATEEIEEGWNWMTPMELLGLTDDEWNETPFEERVTKIKKNGVDSTAAALGTEQEGVGYFIGSLVGSIASPSLMFTMTGKVGTAAYAAADSALYGMGDTGEVDPVTVGISAVTGYGIASGVQKLNKIKKSRVTKTQATKTLGALNNEMNIVAAKTNKPNSSVAIYTEARKNLGLSEKDIDNVTIALKEKIMPPTQSQAIASLEAKSVAETVKKGSATRAGQKIDYILEPISEGIKRISPRIFGKLKRVERELFEDSHVYAMQVDPFLKRAFKGKALNPEQQDKLWLDMSNASSKKDIAKITKFLQDSGKNGDALVADWKLYRNAMDDIYKQRVAAGNTTLNKIEGYSPRKVISNERWYAGAKIGDKAEIDKILKETYNIKNPKDATPATLSKAISKYLQSAGKGKNIKLAGSTKERSVEKLTSKQLSSYQMPWQTSHAYIKESMEEVQRYKVFGTKNIDVDGDIDKTITNFLTEGKLDGTVNGNDIDSLKNLLTARFINGPKAMDDYLKNVKDVGYMTLLGHPSNAVRQLGDLAASMYVNGIKNSMKGVYATLRPGKLLSAKEAGLLDNVAEEFASDTAVRRGVDTVFKYSGFRGIDALGKGALLNSTIARATQQAVSPKGRLKFMNEWSAFLGAEDAAKAVDDFKAFKAGKIDKPTPLMKDIAFMKLSKIQPITLSEMPAAYLNNPNGRMLYMLQSFTLKHINTIRQDIFKEARKGTLLSTAKSAQNFGKLIGYYTAMNLGADQIIDAMLGREREFDESLIINLYRSTGFLSKYDVDQMARDGDPGQFITGLVAPPLQQMGLGAVEIGIVAKNLAMGNDAFADMKNPGKDTLQNIPYIGRLMANWLYD